MRFMAFQAVGFLAVGGAFAQGQSICGHDSITTMSATLPSPRSNASCATDPASGEFYCFGGINNSPGNNNYYYDIVKFDPSTDSMVTTSSLPRGIYNMPCTGSPLTNKIYCFGGRAVLVGGGFERTDEILEYDPSTDTATVLVETFDSGRELAGCATDLTSGKIYCFGGFRHWEPPPEHLDEIVEFDPVSGTLVPMTATLPTERAGMSCASGLNGRIYCFGGFDADSSLLEILEYDPASDTLITKAGTLPAYLAGQCDTDLSTGKIYCFGATATQMISEYDPESDSMQPMTATFSQETIGPGCEYHALSSRFYCVGGRNIASDVFSDVIVAYEPPINCEGIPTLSVWSILAMGLLLISSATLLIARRRTASA